jgi:hypothetical protein
VTERRSSASTIGKMRTWREPAIVTTAATSSGWRKLGSVELYLGLYN